MMRHRNIQEQLYDYVHGDITVVDRTTIDLHLERCTECAHLVLSLRTSLKRSASGIQPADQLPTVYWDSFASTVERRIKQDAVNPGKPLSLLEQIVSEIIAHRKLAASFATGLATIGIAILLWNPWQRTPDTALKKNNTSPVMPASIQADKVSQYFRKSKVLLVGISNLRTTENYAIDLSTEQKLSRELVHESRSLREEDLDPHSAVVIKDLEKILIELANIEKSRVQPQVELIRNGIQQENLLFRLRMAETIRDSMHVMFAGNNQ